MAAETNKTKKTEEAVAVKNTVKADTKKTEVKAATAPAKTEVKKEAKPAAAPAKKEAEAKPAAKKENVKKAPAKKTAAKKTTKKGAKRGPKPASERTVDLHVQYLGKEVAYSDLVNRIKEMWKEQGKRETSLKSLDIYVKPEDFKAYYVINGDITGEIDF